ncbi:chitosanase, partial [Streptomyces sp. NPDC059468]
MEHTERESAVSARLSRRTVVAVLGAVASGALLSVERVAAAPAAAPGLDDPAKKETAMRLVSSAENSSLDWKAQYKYIED